MSNPSLRRRLQDHYGAERLPDRSRDHLCALLSSAPSRTSHGSGWRSPRAWAAGAAILVAAVVGWIVATSLPDRKDGDRAPSAFDIAFEVAANHARDLDPEFHGASYADLRRAMPKLDFSIIEPSRVVGDGLRLVGARYCSVQCAVAAQIRLVDAEAENHTLYEVADKRHFAGVEATEIAVGGVRVRIWREEGLLLCLASPSR